MSDGARRPRRRGSDGDRAPATGFTAGAAIYDHPDNAELKSQRPDPSQLHPGDVVVIPDRDGPKWMDGATEQRHTFRIKRHLLQVYVIDHAGEPIADADCVVIVGGRRTATRTGGDGLVSVPLLRRPASAVVEVGEHRWQLDLGGLNPLRDTLDDAVVRRASAAVEPRIRRRSARR